MTKTECERVLWLLRKYVRETALDPNVQDAFEVVLRTLRDELEYLRRMVG